MGDKSKEPLGSPPSTEASDIALGLARGALSILPGGGVVGELLTLVVLPGLQKRNRRWFRHLAESVDDMRANGLDVRMLADNEPLITVILNATQAAARTHEEEKLEALRNAITNTALGIEPDEYIQMMFIRFVDELQPIHLRLLALFRDPPAFFERHGIPRPTNISRGALIEAAVPEFRNQREIYMQTANEVTARGLLNGSIIGMISEVGMWQPITTQLGNRFLDFISRPERK